MEEIQQHYNSIEEKDRLDVGLGLLEKERTRQIISKYLGGEKLKILDVGGAAGVYSFWLAELGHEVHLSDATPKHIMQARKINQDVSSKLVSSEVGDARHLDTHKGDTADAVLLLGPLYHLVEKQERISALKECFRVIKKGGKLFAAGINRYASLYDGLSRGFN
jgi:2-polyprenyl-3-methyl-5-hydroxy-6-metoxy-1,4-benzoquinol methylase